MRRRIVGYAALLGIGLPVAYLATRQVDLGVGIWVVATMMIAAIFVESWAQETDHA